MTPPRLVALAVVGLAALAPAADPPPGRTYTVTCRAHQEVDGKDVPVTMTRQIDPAKSAVVICDMWDDHWCRSAAKRCDTLAKAVAPMIEAARKQGMTVIHCPSDCMAFYADHPARKRAMAAPKATPPEAKTLPDPPLPIDDSDGGCDDLPQPATRKAWTREHAAIRVDDARDYVTDRGAEVWNVLQANGIKTVFVMGVHTNMCVLNRTFAIKQLRRWGVDCLLVRDVTDAMYNPRMRPFVSHDEGTQLVIKHIERHWCPSVEAKALTGPGAEK
ncbi:MAG: isochorismatase [Gemmataceae bacterium]